MNNLFEIQAWLHEVYMNSKKLSKSRQLAAKLIYAAFKVLKKHGGELLGKEVIKEVEKLVELDEWAKSRYEKSGYIRWQSMLHFFTIDCMKAGFLIKKKGVWYLTPEGENALNLSEVELLNAATEAYKQWKIKNADLTTSDDESDEKKLENNIESEGMTLDEIEQLAIEGIRKDIGSKNPYEFQELAAALLRGMGYFTPFVAPRGKDGGVDIIAYRDPLGTISPRIKVQVKHRQISATVEEIRQLMGLLQKDGDVGIFISTGGFTPDAKTTARSSHVHVELIDLSRLIDLWQEFYSKLSDEDKSKLPLLPIYFLAQSA
ncbi:Mrr restriction endonuclease [Beggiatoa sp. PS]|nr:Mrr restriction endonuclease [Beggiatoa sp. PS]